MENLLNLTLFGSGIAFGIMCILLFLALLLSDVEEAGAWAIVAIIVACGLNYFWGNFPLLSVFTWRNILLYLFLGFIFSIIRTYFKGKELSEDRKKYFNLKDHVFRWWFLFPFSLINWMFGTLLKDWFNICYKGLESFYSKIFNS